MQAPAAISRELTICIVNEWGPEEMISKLSDPFWFQAFGCTLGFDWHSSGLTTTVCGALKEGVAGIEKDLGLYIAGGKGKASRKTPYGLDPKKKAVFPSLKVSNIKLILSLPPARKSRLNEGITKSLPDA